MLNKVQENLVLLSQNNDNYNNQIYTQNSMLIIIYISIKQLHQPKSTFLNFSVTVLANSAALISAKEKGHDGKPDKCTL